MSDRNDHALSASVGGAGPDDPHVPGWREFAAARQRFLDALARGSTRPAEPAPSEQGSREEPAT
jgi:hypothetical protein